MDPVHAALWGVLGGVVVEAYDTVAVLRAARRWPWFDPNELSGRMGRGERWNMFALWAMSVVLRVGAGGGTAAAASSQISGELAAFALGVAGPLALERILAMAHIGTDPADASALSPSSSPAQPAPRQIIREVPPSSAIRQEAPRQEAPDAV